jgi:predicted lipoprotein with Yx(FWY)xxD motif
METIVKRVIAALAVTVVVAGCASMGAAPNFEGGKLVNFGGMTVYTFDRDVAGSGKSVCDAQCAINWPPVMADPSDKASGDWTLVSRDNGWQKQFDKNPTFATSMRSWFVVDNDTIRKQWAYKGKPLYLYIHDKAPGDTTGDGVNNVWHVVKQ